MVHISVIYRQKTILGEGCGYPEAFFGSFFPVRKLSNPLDNTHCSVVQRQESGDEMRFVARRYNTGHSIRDIHKDTGALSITVAQMLGAKRVGGSVGCLAAAASLWAAAKEPPSAWRQDDGEKLPSRELKGPKRAVVVGAGVAGVSTAYQLAKRGWTVTLLEASPYPGSQCSAVAAGGMQKSNPVLTKESWGEVMRSWILPGNSCSSETFLPLSQVNSNSSKLSGAQPWIPFFSAGFPNSQWQVSFLETS